MTDKNEKDLEKVNNKIKNDNYEGLSDVLNELIDGSVNIVKDTLRKFNNNSPRKKKTYIAIKDPEVVAQKAPTSSKSTWLRIATGCAFFFGIIFVIGGISDWEFGLALFGAIVTLIGTKTLQEAKRNDEQIKRFNRYVSELGNNTVITIRDLASSVNLSEEDTIRDIISLQKKGFFKQSRIVENGQLFILDIPTFKAYKEQLRGKNVIKDIENKEKKPIDTTTKEKYQQILEQGENYLQAIDDIKNKIQNREVLEKVVKIETTISNIFATIKKYPEEVYALNKFMDYFLPTTIKLLNSYSTFEQVYEKDSKMYDSMKEIEKSLDTIDDAFKKILVQLYEDKSMDVHTDIDALQMILKQEGLIDDGLGGNND